MHGEAAWYERHSPPGDALNAKVVHVFHSPSLKDLFRTRIGSPYFARIRTRRLLDLEDLGPNSFSIRVGEPKRETAGHARLRHRNTEATGRVWNWHSRYVTSPARPRPRGQCPEIPFTRQSSGESHIQRKREDRSFRD